MRTQIFVGHSLLFQKDTVSHALVVWNKFVDFCIILNAIFSIFTLKQYSVVVIVVVVVVAVVIVVIIQSLVEIRSVLAELLLLLMLFFLLLLLIPDAYIYNLVKIWSGIADTLLLLFLLLIFGTFWSKLGHLVVGDSGNVPIKFRLD